MKEVQLSGDPRPGVGKGSARQARIAGLIPGVVYGPEIDPMPVAIDARAFRAAVKTAGGAAIYNLDIAGKVNKVLVRAIQRDPVTSDVIHVDFHAISMTKPIHLSIPIHFIGTPEGVKTDGGIMQTVMRDLDIACLPANIPEHVEINVEGLGIGESVHVSDLKVPNVEILAEASRTVVVISAPTVIKSATEEEAVEGEEGELAEGVEGAEAAEGAEGAVAAEGADGKPAEGQDKKQDKKGK